VQSSIISLIYQIRIIMSWNSNDTTRNRTHDLAACNAVSQPTAPRRVPVGTDVHTILKRSGARATDGRTRSFELQENT
jgi:hypothetical protein